jgi:hypothetical protein
MRKNILPLIAILPALLHTTQDEKDTTVKQEMKLDAALHEALLKKLNEKQKRNRWGWFIPLLSIVFSLVALWFSWKTFSREKKYKDIEFVAEIDKLVLEHPELAAYEDAKREWYESSVEIGTPTSIKIRGTEKLFFKNSFNCTITALDKDVSVTMNSGNKQVITAGNTKRIQGVAETELIIEDSAKVDIKSNNGVALQSLDDKLLDDKIDAFLYYKLNNFEMALNQPYDESARECWEEYLAWLYRKSTRFKNIIQYIVKTDYGKIYDQDFIKKIVFTLRKKGCDIQIPSKKE